MIIYIPRLIESAEQAEALPLGTIAIRLDDEGRVWTALRRCRCGETDCVAWFSTDWDSAETHTETIGATALVPIEAEEEWEDDGRPVWNIGEGEATPADVDDYERRNGRRPSRRLVTPWEEA